VVDFSLMVVVALAEFEQQLVVALKFRPIEQPNLSYLLCPVNDPKDISKFSLQL